MPVDPRGWLYAEDYNGPHRLLGWNGRMVRCVVVEVPPPMDEFWRGGNTPPPGFGFGNRPHWESCPNRSDRVATRERKRKAAQKKAQKAEKEAANQAAAEEQAQAQRAQICFL